MIRNNNGILDVLNDVNVPFEKNGIKQMYNSGSILLVGDPSKFIDTIEIVEWARDTSYYVKIKNKSCPDGIWIHKSQVYVLDVIKHVKLDEGGYNPVDGVDYSDLNTLVSNWGKFKGQGDAGGIREAGYLTGIPYSNELPKMESKNEDTPLKFPDYGDTSDIPKERRLEPEPVPSKPSTYLGTPSSISSTIQIEGIYPEIAEGNLTFTVNNLTGEVESIRGNKTEIDSSKQYKFIYNDEGQIVLRVTVKEETPVKHIATFDTENQAIKVSKDTFMVPPKQATVSLESKLETAIEKTEEVTKALEDVNPRTIENKVVLESFGISEEDENDPVKLLKDALAEIKELKKDSE